MTDNTTDIDTVREQLSAALDEIWMLRRALAYEARVVEAHYEGLKTFPKSRRTIAEQQVERMRAAVTNPTAAYQNVERRPLDSCAGALGVNAVTVGSWADEIASRRKPRPTRP